jgi:hypothetical protein
MKQGEPNMKAVWILLIFSAVILFIFGCDEEAERENPLDAQNIRTGGAPPGITARAGDSQVILSWPNLGLEGAEEYRIYRAYLSTDEFQFVASVPAQTIDEMPEYTYTDTGLQNDGDNVYFYRLSYVDADGIETPNPDNPASLSEGWYLVNLIPSEAPPEPEVVVIEDTDLQVRLVWEGYADNAPADLSGFRIYSALKAEEGQEQEPFKLIADIEDTSAEFYVDGNEYTENIISFSRDLTTKLYKVVAYDAVNVESDTTILEGTSPNLPPGPPPLVDSEFLLGINTYEVRLTWRRNLEPDVIGYVVYAQVPPEGESEFKKIIEDPNETAALITDRYVVIEGLTYLKNYYVTAFDNTPREDGKRDESEPSEIQIAQ